MSPEFSLSALLREAVEREGVDANSSEGKSLTARQLRGAGFVPAELYGHGIKNVSLAVSADDLRKLLPQISSSTLVTLTLQGEEPKKVLVQALQRDPLKGNPIHLDLLQVKLTEKIRATVPLRPEGVSLAVKDLGGVLVQSLDEIEVEALPQDLPGEIIFNIEELLKTFDDKVTVANLVVGDKVEIFAETEEIVATVQPPRTEQELEELEGEVEEKADEVKTEAEEKKETEEEEEKEEEDKEKGKKEE